MKTIKHKNITQNLQCKQVKTHVLSLQNLYFNFFIISCHLMHYNIFNTTVQLIFADLFSYNNDMSKNTVDGSKER